MDETQILRIKLVGESNLSQVFGKDEAAIAKNITLLSKVGEEQEKHSSRFRKYEEDLTRAQESYALKSHDLNQKEVSERQRYATTIEKSNQAVEDSERQAKEALIRVQEQKVAAEEKYQKKIAQIRASESFGDSIVRSMTGAASPDEEAARAELDRRLEQLSRRESLIQEANLSRSKTLNRAIESENIRHNNALVDIARARMDAANVGVDGQRIADERLEAEAQRHNIALRNLEQQGLNEQRRIQQEQDKNNRRGAFQGSFGAFGLALAGQSILRAFEQGTGDKAASELKVLGNSIGTVSDLMLTGSMINQKYGGTLGAIVGVAVAAYQIMTSLPEEVQKLNQTLDQLAHKEDTTDTLAKVLNVTDAEAQSMLDAAKASGEYAQKLEELAKLKEKNFFESNFLDKIPKQTEASAYGVNQIAPGLGTMVKTLQDAYLARQKQGDSMQPELQRLLRIEQLYDNVKAAAEKYYNAVEKGAADAERENESFAKTLVDLKEKQDALRDNRNNASAENYKGYAEALEKAEGDKEDRLNDIASQRQTNERQWAFDRETIARELGQRLVEIEYQTQQQITQIEHQANEQRRTTLRDFYDAAADAAWQYQSQVAQLNADATKNEQEYQYDVKRLTQQAAIDRAASEKEYASQRAKIARDFAYEKYKIERGLQQSLSSLGFDTGESMRGAKSENELETIQRRYQFEAFQLRQNARNQSEDLAHKTEEDRKALAERQVAERTASADRLRMAKEELDHRIALQRTETAQRRKQLDLQYAHDRAVADRELAQKMEDIDRAQAYDKQQAEAKAEHDRVMANQQAADQRRQQKQQEEEAKKALDAQEEAVKTRYKNETESAKKAYEDQKLELNTRYQVERDEIEATRLKAKAFHDEQLQNINDEIEAYRLLLQSMSDSLGKYPGAQPNRNFDEGRIEVPGHAAGVDNMLVNRKHLFVAGERGAEVVNIKPVGHQGSGGSDRPINFYIYDARDPDMVEKKVQSMLRRELRRL